MYLKMIQKIVRIIPIPIKSDTSKPLLYEYLYTKHEGFGFTEKQDLEILKKLYPDARNIKVIYSVRGESHFVITH